MAKTCGKCNGQGRTVKVLIEEKFVNGQQIRQRRTEMKDCGKCQGLGYVN